MGGGLRAASANLTDQLIIFTVVRKVLEYNNQSYESKSKLKLHYDIIGALTRLLGTH